MHKEPSELAGKKLRLKENAKHPDIPRFGGSLVVVEDWWDRVAGKSWMICDGNPACLIFGFRTANTSVPTDNEVLYVHDEVGFGHLVHLTEISLATAD